MWSETWSRQQLSGALPDSTASILDMANIANITDLADTSKLPPPQTPVLRSPDGKRAAIVSTMRFPAFGAHVVQSFIDYHLAVGFVHLYLFFDDPSDLAVGHASSYSKDQVTVTTHDAYLRERWKKCGSYQQLAPFIDDEVQARQHLNCEIAMELALSDYHYVDWLLHIDSDELFHTEKTSVVEHFQHLWNDGVYQMTYLNHEGIPEVLAAPHATADDKEKEESTTSPALGVDYFKETTLFRRHHLDIPMSALSRSCMEYWEQRTTHGQYMLCYDNGKSVCRVVRGARPSNVHKWSLPTPASMPSRTALVDPRHLNLSEVRKCSDPCVLHYVVCGLPWLKSKYEMLGSFEDAWFGGKLPIAPSFHLDARDALLRGDVETVWNTQVVFREETVMRSHVKAGVLLRMYKPQEILMGQKKEDRIKEKMTSKEARQADQEKQANQATQEKRSKKKEAPPALTAPTPASAATTDPDPAAIMAALMSAGMIGGSDSFVEGKKESKESKKKKKEKKKEEKKDEKSSKEFTYSKAWMMSQAVQNFL